MAYPSSLARPEIDPAMAENAPAGIAMLAKQTHSSTLPTFLPNIFPVAEVTSPQRRRGDDGGPTSVCFPTQYTQYTRTSRITLSSLRRSKFPTSVQELQQVSSGTHCAAFRGATARGSGGGGRLWGACMVEGGGHGRGWSVEGAHHRWARRGEFIHSLSILILMALTCRPAAAAAAIAKAMATNDCSAAGSWCTQRPGQAMGLGVRHEADDGFSIRLRGGAGKKIRLSKRISRGGSAFHQVKNVPAPRCARTMHPYPAIFLTSPAAITPLSRATF